MLLSSTAAMVAVGGESSRVGSSSVKATGWIRAASSPRAATSNNSRSVQRKVLGERTNLPPISADLPNPTPKGQPTLTSYLTPRASTRTKQRVETTKVRNNDDDDDLEMRATSFVQRRSGTARERPSKRPRLPASPPPIGAEIQDSLSNQTPPRWLTALGASHMALYQRLAGLPDDEIRSLQQEHMQQQIRHAHHRLSSSSPIDPPREVARSPQSRRRIYAFETQRPDESDETQPLPWSSADDQAEPDSESVALVPTSDDEERLITSLALPTSSPPPPSANPTQGAPETRRINADRFPQVLASLAHHQRKSQPGAQLSLTSFLATPHRTSTDLLQDCIPLSDDDDDGETQPLPWADDDDNNAMSLPTLESLDHNHPLLTPKTKRFLHNL